MDEGDAIKPELSAEEKALREEVEASERVLVEFERDLDRIDTELEDLSQKDYEIDLLRKICSSLEELDNLGANHLLWADGNGPHDRLRHAHRKLEEHAEEVARTEERRGSAADKIGDQNLALDALHYDLRDVFEREASRRREWVVEREAEEFPSRVQIMPWARGFEEDNRFRRSLAASVMVSILVGLLVVLVDLPILEREALIEVPERVAKLVREEREPPPPPVVEPVIEEEQIPDPEELVAEDLPPEEQPKAEEEPVVAEVPQPDTREQVKSKGILAFRDSFASRASDRPTARLGSQARVSNAGESAVGRPERNMVSTSAPGSSGGINLADYSRNVGSGGEGIDGVELTRVASSIGGGEGPDRPLSAGFSAGRTDEEIQIVFDRYKAALYRLYNRELRKNPTLRGQIVLRLTIEPDGTVSLCQVQSSDMDAPLLADQVLTRVSNFDFGAKEDIVAMTIIYPIDFLPAA